MINNHLFCHKNKKRKQTKILKLLHRFSDCHIYLCHAREITISICKQILVALKNKQEHLLMLNVRAQLNYLSKLQSSVV